MDEQQARLDKLINDEAEDKRALSNTIDNIWETYAVENSDALTKEEYKKFHQEEFFAPGQKFS